MLASQQCRLAGRPYVRSRPPKPMPERLCAHGRTFHDFGATPSENTECVCDIQRLHAVHSSAFSGSELVTYAMRSFDHGALPPDIFSPCKQ